MVDREPGVVNHRVAARSGGQADRAGAYLVDWWPTAARDAAEVADRYADLGVGLTDASLVILAARVESTDIATFDERHFRAVRPLLGAEAFRLLPLDMRT